MFCKGPSKGSMGPVPVPTKSPSPATKLQVVASPIRLYPNDVGPPEQSGLVAAMFPATIVFFSSVRPESLNTPPPTERAAVAALWAMVLLEMVNVADKL